MTERPILFSDPMVRALLADLKTQTRRVVKGVGADWLASGFEPGFVASPENRLCRYGSAGGRLWVREAWCASDTSNGFAYRADTPVGSDQRGLGWRPSIHMPRAACRLILEITDIRVDRLQSISDADAEAEGVREPGLGAEVWCGFIGVPRATCPAKTAYAMLWEEIHGAGAWGENPWVWAVSFKRVAS